MIIGISGTHGTGKTTMLHRLAHHYKKQEKTKTVFPITEVCRDCPFDIFSRDRESSIEGQVWMFNEQLNRELKANAKYDIVITDRSLIDYVVYTSFVDENVSQNMLNYLKSINHKYDIITFLKLNHYIDLSGFDDGFRHLDRQFQIEVDQKIEELLDGNEFAKKIEVV